jgi:aspartate-semialdehyde dehydrogenase
MSDPQLARIVIFGVTGHLGQEVVARLDAPAWSKVEVVGVVSEDSTEAEFEFRGELVDAVTTSPPLRKGDLVFVCTPGEVAMEVVRAALHAQVPCIDCTGVMAEQAEVPTPVRSAELRDEGGVVAQAPLLAIPGATALAWVPLLEALIEASGITRVVATTLKSASALGRRGLVALSEESIALFNQSEIAQSGPAGQAVAFDVIPNATSESRTADELDRIFDSKLRIDVMNVQVPTFVGEGASLAIELSSPMDASALLKVLGQVPSIELVEDGVGTRGLAPVDAGLREPTGPTLRDAAGAEGVLVGGIRPDASLPAGLGWRVWLSYDPARVAGAHAIRLASLRFPSS